MKLKGILIKAYLFKAGKKDYSKLVRQVIINKRGNKQTVYRRIDKPTKERTNQNILEELKSIKASGFRDKTTNPLEKVFIDTSSNKEYREDLFKSAKSQGIPTVEVPLHDIAEVKLIGRGTLNATFLLISKDGKKWIYKPGHLERYKLRVLGKLERGFKFSQFMHEGLFCKVASLAGLDYLFPKTSIARIGDSYGALIEYIGDPNYEPAYYLGDGLDSFIEKHPKDYAKMVLLDYIAGHTDRNRSNFFVNRKEGKIKAIDQGLTFEKDIKHFRVLEPIKPITVGQDQEGYFYLKPSIDVSEFRENLRKNKDQILRLVRAIIPKTVVSPQDPYLSKRIVLTFEERFNNVINAPEDKIPISGA
jgi:hypothetical protein